MVNRCVQKKELTEMCILPVCNFMIITGFSLINYLCLCKIIRFDNCPDGNQT